MSHGARSGENGRFCKTVTFSNFKERKSKETNIPQSPTFIENAVNNEWQSDRKPVSFYSREQNHITQLEPPISRGHRLIC